MDRRDKEYFNGKMFLFTNKLTKEKASKLAKQKQLPLYFLIDEAIRDYLNKNGTKVEYTPRKLTLI